jgi:hypothetical protein
MIPTCLIKCLKEWKSFCAPVSWYIDHMFLERSLQIANEDIAWDNG